MKLPGFTAERSLSMQMPDYRADALAHNSITSSVVPQARALEKCHARCLGGYFGSAGACFGTANSDICFSAAGNRYNRCGSMCDMLYE
jgi:hypothetical protein